MSQNHIFSVKDIAFNAMFGALLFIVYMFFSQILYVEFVTITVLLYALTFKTKNAVTSSIIFATLVVFVYGLQPWSMMYFVVWPLYAFIISKIQRKIRGIVLITFIGFIMSLLSGTIIDLPYFFIMGKEVTIAYLLLGFKTSLVSASLTAAFILMVFEPLHKFLKQYKSEEL